MSFARSNDPHKCVKPEDMESGDVVYAFTLNPEEQYFGDEERMAKVIQSTKNNLRRVFGVKCIKPTLYIEISSKGRYHFHGLLTITDIPYFFDRLPLLQKWATYEVDTIESHEIWHKYCQKQSRYFKSLPKITPGDFNFTNHHFFINGKLLTKQESKPIEDYFAD